MSENKKGHPPGATRREVMQKGGRLALGTTALGTAVLGASVLGVAGSMMAPATLHAIDWSKLYRNRMPDVSGTVRSLVGMAYAGKKSLALGDSVPSGALVRVAEEGKIVIGLADGGIFTVFGGSELELFLEKMSQGLLHLLAGALLMVAPKGSHYLVAGNEATFGIKGTVVFRKVLNEQDHMMYGPDASMAIPEGATGYFCTCYGEVDFLHRAKLHAASVPASMELSSFHQSSTTYHDAQFLTPPGKQGELGLAPIIHHAPMLGHSDRDIAQLVALQSEPRHPTHWLRKP